MSNRAHIEKYITENYSYDDCQDPLEIVSCTKVDDLLLSLWRDENLEFTELAKAGDWWIEDGQNSELVRFVAGKVKRIWSNG